jgi:sensor histidine kinase YesM
LKDWKKNNIATLGFNDVWLRIIGIPMISLILPILLMDSSQLSSEIFYWSCLFISFLFTTFYWHLDRAIIIYIRKKYEPKDLKKRIITQALVVITLTLLLSLLSNYLTTKTLSDYLNRAIPFHRLTIVSLVVTTLIVSFYEVWYIFDIFKHSLVQNEALKKENSEAQLQALKNQLNPHFLFNSLNTLVSIIPENQKMAVSFVENLSTVYRYILQIKDKDIVTLEEELKCITAYEYLIKIRFGDNINFIKNNFNEKKELHLIPLSIQMLIENAIKHNIVSKSKPLTITLTIGENSLSVKNNLQLKSSIEHSTKVGLNNINKRFELLTNQSIKIKAPKSEFEVIIPLINIGTIL